MRYPRKLKKGIRTLNGKPKTKWQRRGHILATRAFRALGDAAVLAARPSWLPHIDTSHFEPGGIMTPSAMRQTLAPEEMLITKDDHQKIAELMKKMTPENPITVVVDIDTANINKTFDRHIKP